MNTKRKRMALGRETLRNLQPDELALVAGGELWGARWPRVEPFLPGALDPVRDISGHQSCNGCNTPTFGLQEATARR